MSERPRRERSARRAPFTPIEPPPAPVGRITGLVEHPRQPGRYQLEVQDAVPVTVSASVIAALELRIGRVLDAAAGAAVAREAAALATYDKAVALLAVKGRSARELERRLQRIGHPPEAIAAALARLTAEGFVDDERLARQVARAKLGTGSVARRRVEQDLARRGVDRTVARVAVEETVAEEEVDERSAAVELARRRLGTLRGLEPAVQRRRLFGYLARRGFALGEVGAVVRQVLGEDADATDDAPGIADDG